MRASRLLPILSGLLLSPATADATATATAEPGDGELNPRELAARDKCDDGRTRAGVALFAQLFVETLDPIYIYRQAQCYQRNDHDESAIERYREYLRRRPDASERDRQWIEARIGEIEAKIPGATAVDRSLIEPPPLAFATTTAAPPPAHAASLAAVRAPATASRSTPGSASAPGGLQPDLGARAAPPPPAGRFFDQSWQRVSSLVLATGAGAALGTALTFHVARDDGPRRLSLEARMRSPQAVPLIGYAAAALLAGGSTVLYLSAPESRPGPPPALAALSCTPQAALAGVTCGGRF